MKKPLIETDTDQAMREIAEKIWDVALASRAKGDQH